MSELANLLPQHLQPLTSAEEFMVQAFVAGGTAVCSPNSNDFDPENNPEDASNWHHMRTIRAELIQWLCGNSSAVQGIGHRGIHIYAAKILGAVELSYARIHFPLIFERCNFAEDIQIKNATISSLLFKGSRMRGLLADGIEVANNILLVNVSTHGEVVFRDAKIGGSFRADGGVFIPEAGMALGCDRIKVGGSAILSTTASPSHFRGEVGLAGAWIGSNLECDAGIFENDEGYAIRADRLTVVGSAFSRSGFSAKGEVRLINSKIGSILACRGGSFSNPGKIALNVEAARITSAALFDGDANFVGELRLLGAEMGDGMSCQLGRFTHVDLRYAKVSRSLRWILVRDAQRTILDLRHASIDAIEDDEDSWPSPGNFFADGLTYEKFADCSTNLSARLRWIRLDTSNAPQLYRQLAHVYSLAGQTKEARHVLYILEDLLRNRAKNPPRFYDPSQVLAFLLKWTVGYGYKLGRAATWMFLLIAVGLAIGDFGYREKIIVPLEKDAYSSFAKTGQPPPSYPRFSSLMYSIEHSIPAINLGISSNWSANSSLLITKHPLHANILRWWFSAQTIFGWTLSIFFIAGLTGVIKSDK